MAKETVPEGVPESLPKDFVLQSGFTVGQVAAKNCDSIQMPNQLTGEVSDYWIEPKYDGFRLMAVRTRDDLHIYTRSMKRQDGRIPYIESELMRMMPPGTIVDGEVIALQENADGTIDPDFEHVQSIMLSNPPEAIRKAREIRPLDYALFDMTWHGGDDMRLHQAKHRRAQLIEQMSTGHWERLIVSPSLPATDEQHIMICNRGFEGTVAKRVSSFYENDGRGKGWYKIKTQWEFDVVVVGYIEGTPGSEYDGLIGGIEFGQPLDRPERLEKWKGSEVKYRDVNGVRYLVRGSCSGLTLDMRRHVSANRTAHLGQTMTVGHMGAYKKSPRVRHPQFKRWRPDKPAPLVSFHDR